MRAFRIVLRVVGVSALLALLVVILLDVGQPLSPGTPAPPVEGARLLDGRTGTLRFGGRPTVVNVWAAWCAPCLAELPDLVASHRGFGDRVQFVGLATESDHEAVVALVQRFGVDYDVAEIDERTAHLWKVTSLPSTYLVGADGRIAWSTRGQLDRATLDAEIGKLLPVPPVPPVPPGGQAR